MAQIPVGRASSRGVWVDFEPDLGRLQQISRESGVTVLMVEQKVREALKISGRVYVLRNGRVSFTGPVEELKDDSKLREVYL